MVVPDPHIINYVQYPHISYFMIRYTIRSTIQACFRLVWAFVAGYSLSFHGKSCFRCGFCPRAVSVLFDGIGSCICIDTVATVYSRADSENSLYKHCSVFRCILSYRAATQSSTEPILFSQLNEPRYSHLEVTYEKNATALAAPVSCATAETLQRASSEVRLKGGCV
ncbi:hypothetical protein BDR07DRAFT_1386780 [Suillus spraguei]|nr:hypothetical protein BDR07DRAFT_1386780 [Suillus spraguei]